MSQVVTDKFQSRDELVQFIEEKTTAAVEKAVPYHAARVDRRLPWATSRPVGQDSAGYSVLKAAAFALGFVGPEQAKEEIHTHHQLRDLYASYGFLPHHGQQSFLVPIASAHLPVFEPHGQAMLEGTGGTQIKGLITYSGIGTHTASTTGANGDTFQPQDVALMEAKLPDAVDAPSAWVMRKALFAALMNRRADAVAASDGKGPFLFRNTSSASASPPAELYGTKVVRSGQVSAARAKGAATNLTYVLLGYFPDWRVGGPPPRRKFLNSKPFAGFHNLHASHISARFSPHSVHYSVHEKSRRGWRVDLVGASASLLSTSDRPGSAAASSGVPSPCQLAEVAA